MHLAGFCITTEGRIGFALQIAPQRQARPRGWLAGRVHVPYKGKRAVAAWLRPW